MFLFSQRFKPRFSIVHFNKKQEYIRFTSVRAKVSLLINLIWRINTKASSLLT